MHNLGEVAESVEHRIADTLRAEGETHKLLPDLRRFAELMAARKR